MPTRQPPPPVWRPSRSPFRDTWRRAALKAVDAVDGWVGVTMRAYDAVERYTQRHLERHVHARIRAHTARRQARIDEAVQAAAPVATPAPAESPLFAHTLHPHQARNVNAVHAAEHAQASFSQRLAVLITKMLGTMQAAYVCTFLAFVGLLGLLQLLNPFTFLLASWLSQQFLQLVALPVLAVGQQVLGHKQELQADEQFATTQKTYADIVSVIEHLNAQDEKILMILHLLEQRSRPRAPKPEES